MANVLCNYSSCQLIWLTRVIVFMVSDSNGLRHKKNIDSTFELMQYRDRELMENLLQKRMIVDVD